MSIDYIQLLSNYNWTGLVASAYPESLPIQNTYGRYSITYGIIDSGANAISFGYDGNSDWVDAAVSILSEQIIAIGQVTTAGWAWGVEAGDVANIVFSEGLLSSAHIAFGATKIDQFADSDEGGVTLVYAGNPDALGANATVWLNEGFDLTPSGGNPDGQIEWVSNQAVTLHTIRHELLHTLGMDDFEGTPLHNSTLYDSQRYSILSYNIMAGMDPAGIGNEVYPIGLQLLDIAAIQAIYGANYSTRNELLDSDPLTTGTTYGIGSGFGATAATPFLYTIWDGGGTTDAIDATGYSAGVEIDLREGRFSSIGNLANGTPIAFDSIGFDAGNVAIAYGTTIENAVGTAYNDSLIGNEAANLLTGGAGTNVLAGDTGDDVYRVDFSQALGTDTIMRQISAGG